MLYYLTNEQNYGKKTLTIERVMIIPFDEKRCSSLKRKVTFRA